MSIVNLDEYFAQFGRTARRSVLQYLFLFLSACRRSDDDDTTDGKRRLKKRISPFAEIFKKERIDSLHAA
jgi:hypothetical protein